MKMRMVILSLWALSLVFVYMVARHAAPGPGLGAGTASSADAPPGTDAKAAVRPADAGPTPAAVPRTVEKVVFVNREIPVEKPAVFGDVRLGDIDSSSIRRLLPAALADGGDVMAKNLLMAQLLAGLNADNVHAALEVFENAPGNPMNDHNFRMFMQAWGKIDGRAAVEYAFFNEEGRKVSRSGWEAMKAWGGQDPGAARTYIESLGADNRQGGYMIDALVRGWAANDLAGVSEYATALSDPGLRNQLVEYLADEHMKQQGPGPALAWADTVVASHEDAQYAGRVLTEVAVRAARADAVTARDWLERNLDSEYLNPRIFEEVADEMAAIDPQAAAAFLNRHFEDERVNSTVIAEMTEEWARKDPAAAAAWVSQYLGHEKINQDVVYELAGEWAARDPVGAMDWVAGLQDEGLQQRGLGSAVEHWARQDATAAGNWLNQQPRAGGLYDPAIEAYANSILRTSPIAALSWAQEIEDSDRWERTTVRAGQAMLREDKEAVVAWLPDSGLSERAQQAVLHPPRRGRR